ncbi:MAG: hypothetical protein ABI885_08975 [Gammaproteobacteria bacterium]
MSENEANEPIDWSLTTWEGARREQQRRWANLSLREIILALEDMQELAERLSSSPNLKSKPAA